MMMPPTKTVKRGPAHQQPHLFRAAAWRRSASIVSAHTSDQIICVVTVHAPDRYAAVVIAHAVVADTLKIRPCHPAS
jgi:hypothetical protein